MWQHGNVSLFCRHHLICFLRQLNGSSVEDEAQTLAFIFEPVLFGGGGGGGEGGGQIAARPFAVRGGFIQG